MKYVQDALDAYMQAHNADASIFPEMDILYLVAPPSATFSRLYAYMWEPEIRMPNNTGNDTVGTAAISTTVSTRRASWRWHTRRATPWACPIIT